MTNTKLSITPPTEGEYNPYYQQYIGKCDAENFFSDFESQPLELKQLLGGLSEEAVSKLHDPYTWTLKQVVGHLIDCERIFSTRLLRIAVGDETPIPGIDQNIYVSNLDYGQVSMSDLLEEFAHLRASNVLLASRLTEDSLQRMGVASESPISARANLFILVGHVKYHAEIIERRLS